MIGTHQFVNSNNQYLLFIDKPVKTKPQFMKVIYIKVRNFPILETVIEFIAADICSNKEILIIGHEV